MRKHWPFGWVTDGFYKSTICLNKDCIELAILKGQSYTYEIALEDFKFADGTPFGIKED